MSDDKFSTRKQRPSETPPGLPGDVCTCGQCGGRVIPPEDTAVREKIAKYRREHNLPTGGEQDVLRRP